MKISKLALIALLGSALTAFGCGSSSGDTGGTGGIGGTGGTGGGTPVACDTTNVKRCMSVPVKPLEKECCDRAAPPEQTDACVGTESVTNPPSCEASGNPPVVHKLTLLGADGDCDSGYDLDNCDGTTCASGALYAGEGLAGIDNQLAALGPLLDVAGANLDGIDQAFSDALCGLTDDPTKGTCEGGDNPGIACTADGAECTGTGAKCNLDDTDCLVESAPLDILFEVDANPAANCATLTITSGGTASDPVFLNLAPAANGTCTGGSAPSGTSCATDAECPDVQGTCSVTTATACTLDGDCPVEETCQGADIGTCGGATACLSGTLGTIPITIAGVSGSLGNSVVRTTVSAAGFSDGVLSATVDQETAVTIANIVSDIAGPLVPNLLDINVDLTQDNGVACNALSVGLKIGGAAQAQ